MATRMQQRRGTAAQWTSADPILASGEIGFESDTGQFKIGDGINHWEDLSYFKNLEDLGGSLDDYVPVDTKGQANGVASLDATGNVPISQLSNIIDGAPAALNTLNEIAAAIADDGTFAATMVNSLSGKLSTSGGIMSGSLNMNSNLVENLPVPTEDDHAATKLYADQIATASAAALSGHESATTNVHGIANTALLATSSDVSTSVSNHNSATTNVHGIADTSLLALKSEVAAVTKTTLGLGNVDNTSDADKPVSTATVTAIAAAKAEAIAEVTAVIDGAPNALNTLNELAAALGDDANFASTITTSLAAKVDSYTPITQKTSSYTLSTLDHRDDLIEMGSSSAVTLTIPLNSTIAYPVGTSFDVLQTGTGQVTIAGANGVTVNATPGLKLRTQWSSATVFKRAENTWVVYGDLMA